MGTLSYFLAFFTKGSISCDLFCFPGQWNPSQKKEFTLNPIALRKAKIVYNFGLSECSRVKGKNMLALEDQILSFKNSSCLRREAKMKMAELIPQKVNLFTYTKGTLVMAKSCESS